MNGCMGSNPPCCTSTLEWLDGPLRVFRVHGKPARRLVGRRQLVILAAQDIGRQSRL
jgi:hypothetical protein